MSDASTPPGSPRSVAFLLPPGQARQRMHRQARDVCQIAVDLSRNQLQMAHALAASDWTVAGAVAKAMAIAAMAQADLLRDVSRACAIEAERDRQHGPGQGQPAPAEIEDMA